MAKPAPVPKSFEAALAELESLIQGMESGRLGLDESLSAYQRGMQLLRHCQEALTAAEGRIRVLEQGQLEALTPADGAEA
ncbi:MAG: exodeoxyribonuclease VII small subunit [Xanthomonadales bacterium]|jgi:exodeoxyribonuclease VII small subunit|nr:exodeoxyribonuclease VII small subunit [Xanthomonadales bacterium]